jgi:hypothetical protein
MKSLPLEMVLKMRGSWVRREYLFGRVRVTLVANGRLRLVVGSHLPDFQLGSVVVLLQGGEGVLGRVQRHSLALQTLIHRIFKYAVVWRSMCKMLSIEVRGLVLGRKAREEGGLYAFLLRLVGGPQVCVPQLEESLHCLLPDESAIDAVKGLVFVDRVTVLVAFLTEVVVLANSTVVTHVQNRLHLAEVALVVHEGVGVCLGGGRRRGIGGDGDRRGETTCRCLLLDQILLHGLGLSFAF